MNRRFWMWVHRCNGLLLAGFLVVAGLSGSVLAYHDALDRRFAKDLFTLPPYPLAVERADRFAIAERVQSQHPRFQIYIVSLHPNANWPIVMSLRERAPQPEGWTAESLVLTVTADPSSGRILGERREGDLAEGWKNLLPFVDRLHENLALGRAGTLCLGLAALLWTIDCFVGLYLTFPSNSTRSGRTLRLRISRWPLRWAPSWLVRWTHGSYKRLYDLHRALGLWLWLCLLIFAWTGVAFNLSSVHA